MLKPLQRHSEPLLHGAILTGTLGCILLLIALTHPDCVYGSQTDWGNQHFAIPEYFRTRFYATGNLFPNLALHLGGGQNIYNFAYYGLYSPVFLLSFALPWVSMANYIMVTHVLLIWLSSLLCNRWLQRWFPSRLALFLSLLFLLSAPLIFHSHHHIMFISYFPFLFWGLFRIPKALEKRFSLGLIAACVFTILTSFFFSVGAFLMLLLYGIFLTLHQHQVHIRKQLLRSCGILLVHLLLSVLIAGFLLLPVAMTLFSGRDASTTGLSLWKALLPGVYTRYLTYSPFSPGLTSIAILAAIGLCRITERSFRFLSVTFLVLILCPLLLYLLNGTLYLDAKAYIPLLPLLVLLCGFFFQQLQARQIPRKQTAFWFAAVLLISICTHDGYISEFVAVLLDGSVTFVAYLMCCSKRNLRYLQLPILSMSIAACLVLNLADGYMKQDSLDVMYSSEIQALIDEIQAQDQSFTRISNEYHAGDTVNRIWGANYYRSSVYSSVHNTALTDFCFQQTHSENSIRNRTMLVQSKNPIFGILMGEKYVISQEKLQRYGYQQISQKGNYRLYENTLAMPIGFATSHVISQEALESASYPAQLELFLENAVVPAENLPSQVEVSSENATQMQQIYPSYTIHQADSDKITDVGEGYYVHSKEEFHVTLTLDQPIDKLLLLKFHVNNQLGNGSATGDVSITINGIRNRLTDPTWKYQNGNQEFQYAFSSQEPIRTLQMTLSAGDYVLSDAAFYTMSYDVLEQAAQTVDALQVNTDTLGDDTIAGSISVKKDGWFVLSIPYDAGFRIQIDGTETACIRTDVDFIGCPISAGTHTVTITYTAPGATLGKRCTCIGLGITGLCFAGNLLLRRRKATRKRFNTLAGV